MKSLIDAINQRIRDYKGYYEKEWRLNELGSPYRNDLKRVRLRGAIDELEQIKQLAIAEQERIIKELEANIHNLHYHDAVYFSKAVEIITGEGERSA